MAIEYRVLGPLEVLRDGAAVQPSSAKVRALLAVLLVRHNEVVPVHALVDALWPGDPPTTAHGVIQTYVSQLRKVLEPGLSRGDRSQVLVTAEPGYRLAVAAGELDAARFETAVDEARAASRAGRPAAAAELLRGGLGLWRGPAYSDIAQEGAVHSETIRLDELRVLAIEERIDAEIALGRHAELIGELNQLVAEHPLRERFWAQLMLCLYRQGRQADALRTFQALRGRLGEELGIEPGPGVARLEQDILTHAPRLDWTPPAGGAGPHRVGRRPGAPVARVAEDRLPFVGREVELAALGRWWSDPDGERLALVTGEAGVGKTQLVATCARRVERLGARVLTGRAVERQGPSYEPVLGALRQLVVLASEEELDTLSETTVGALSRLVPEVAERLPEVAARAASWGDLDRSWLLDTVAQGFAGTAPPVLLVLEDLQWADPAALLLLARVLAHGTGARVLATCRTPTPGPPGPVQDFLADLRRDDVGVHRIHLEGLTRDDVVELVGALAGGDLSLAGRSLAVDLHRRTAGNSFFLRETLRHLEDTGAISPRDDVWAADRPLEELGVPAGVKEVVAQRLGRLEPATTEVLQAAAVVGVGFDVDVLSVVVGGGETLVIEALEEASTAGLVRAAPTRLDHYEFVHALVRETLLDAASASRRVRLAWRTGSAVEALRSHALDEHAADIARYYIEGAAVGDAATAVHWAVRAGERAMAHLAHEEAVHHLDAALGCLPLVRGAPAGLHVDVLVALGRASVAAGDPVRWREVGLEAASLAGEAGDARRLAEAAIALLGPLGPGALDVDVVTVLEEAAGALRTSPDAPALRSLLAEVLARLSGYLTNVRPGDSVRLADEALDIARAAQDRRTLALALIYSTQAHVLDRDEHLARLREAVALAGQLDDVEVALLATTNLMTGALLWSDRAEFDLRLGEYARIADRTRSPVHLLLSAIDGAGATALDGRYAEAHQQARALLRPAHQLGDPNNVGNIGATLIVVNRELGIVDIDAVRRALDANPDVPSYQPALVFALCETGANAEGAELLWSLLEEPSRILEGFMRRFNLAMLAEAAHLLVDGRAAAVLHPWLHQGRHLGDGVIIGPNTYFGAVRRHLGLLDHTMGRYEDAVGHHDAALDVHERMRARGWAARSRYDLARSLLARGGDGDATRAARLIDEAAGAVESLGMPRLQQQLAALQEGAPAGLTWGTA